MRHLKMMGVAALAVFALVAFAGATTASATRLCTTNTASCTHFYAHTDFQADLVPGTNWVWTTSGSPTGINPTMTCSVVNWGLTNSSAGGAAGVAVAVRLTSLALTSCTSANPTGCEASATVGSLASATGQIAWTAGVNGTLTFTPPTMSWSCPILGAPVTCTYGGSGALDGTVTGGTDAVVDFTNQSVASVGGFGCPTVAQMNARFTVTRHPLFITNS